MNDLRKWIRLIETQSSASQLVKLAQKAVSPDVDIDLTIVDADRVTIETLHIHGPKRRMGLGSQTMKMLCDLADQLGVSLELHPSPTDGDIDPDDLRSFYQKFGFVTDNVSGWMVREP